MTGLGLRNGRLLLCGARFGGKRAVFDGVVYTLGMFGIPDEPTGVAAANGRLSDVDHILNASMGKQQTTR